MHLSYASPLVKISVQRLVERIKKMCIILEEDTLHPSNSTKHQLHKGQQSKHTSHSPVHCHKEYTVANDRGRFIL